MTLPDNSVALFAEGRFDNCNDLGGHTDIVFKTSTDGRTWSKLYIAYGESTHTPANPNGTRVTIGNPAPVVVDGKVLLLCSRNAQRLLRLRSLDSTGLTWPKTADDITVETFQPANIPVVCMPGALGLVATCAAPILRWPKLLRGAARVLSVGVLLPRHLRRQHVLVRLRPLCLMCFSKARVEETLTQHGQAG